MSTPESTCWTLIQAAAAGSLQDREELARRYLGVVSGHLAARWRGSGLSLDLDDAVQEVFVEFFRQGGVLQVVGTGRVPHFRAYLYGVVRNVARRYEARPGRQPVPLPDIPSNEASLSQLFDRTWAEAIMAEAVAVQRAQASQHGPRAVQRMELLRLRFEENLPIRTIAERWGIPAAHLHHEYAVAREEFRTALLEVVAFHHPGTPAEVEQEATSLLHLLR